MGTRLFIDTNVFLSFFHLTKEDIEQLKKLVALMENGQIELILPTHVRDEFRRNRENKIKDALKKLEDFKFSVEFPVFCKAYQEYDDLRKLIKEANKKHAQLYKQVESHAHSGSLNADPVIQAIFEKAKVIEITDEIYEAARKRVEIGNPPGKSGSLGDAINWECLLRAVAEDDWDDTYLVTGDADYSSALSKDKIDPFLKSEWAKIGDIILYRSLSEFFKDKFPTIKLASEVESDLAIQGLASSNSFASTHIAISKLGKCGGFSIPQVEQLASIPEANNQVGWIITDNDVHEFYSLLFDLYGGQVSKETRDKLQSIVDAANPGVDKVSSDDVSF